jgi:hypothetical protein
VQPFSESGTSTVACASRNCYPVGAAGVSVRAARGVREVGRATSSEWREDRAVRGPVGTVLRGRREAEGALPVRHRGTAGAPRRPR